MRKTFDRLKTAQFPEENTNLACSKSIAIVVFRSQEFSRKTDILCRSHRANRHANQVRDLSAQDDLDLLSRLPNPPKGDPRHPSLASQQI